MDVKFLRQNFILKIAKKNSAKINLVACHKSAKHQDKFGNIIGFIFVDF